VPVVALSANNLDPNPPKIVCDGDGCIHGMNAKAELLFGYASSEVSGQPLFQLFQVETSQGSIDENIKAAIGIRSDGTTFGTGVCLCREKNDSSFNWVATFHENIADFQDANIAEEPRIFENTNRTSELAEALEVTQLECDRQTVQLQLQADELESAKREAKKAIANKCDFIAGMSHQIRTPMTSIIGFAEVVLDEYASTSATEEMRQAIETIHRNGEKLVHLMNDILELSKIEAGHAKPANRPCRPQQIFAEIKLLMEKSAASKQVALEFELDSSVPEKLTSDPTRIRQILVNLVENSIRFTDRGCVRVRAFYEHRNEQLHFIVKDTGIGMSPQRMKNLFQPFDQESSGGSESGNGLGLHLCARICEMLGGQIQAESELGVGTSIRFHVSAISSSGMPEPASLDEGIHRETTGEFPLNGFTILLVEDGIDNQKLIRRLLERSGAEVQIAENGVEALESILDSDGLPRLDCNFDLILMDLQMPVMDGVEATRRLREAGFGLPIVALTAHATSEHQERCLEAGCDGFLTKPVRKTELIQAVISHLERLGSGC
jgi:signal transduction histidine kinase/CheY-like chemotaxis protein